MPQHFYLRCFKSYFDAVKGKFGLLIEYIEMVTSNCATLRPFSLAEQCHTQNFYLRCFKSDFDAVKSKFGLLIELIEMAISNSATLIPFIFAEQCHIQNLYLMCFKSTQLILGTCNQSLRRP